MGAVDVSLDGGFLQRSVFGGAARVKDPIHSGTTSFVMFSGVNDELVGGMMVSRVALVGRCSGESAAGPILCKLRDRSRM